MQRFLCHGNYCKSSARRTCPTWIITTNILLQMEKLPNVFPPTLENYKEKLKYTRTEQNIYSLYLWVDSRGTLNFKNVYRLEGKSEKSARKGLKFP